MIRQTTKLLLIFLGWFFFILGLVGIFLPLLPTTPFLILSAACFSRGSEKLHMWLLNLPHLGQYIRNWETYGVIPLRAKVVATGLMLISFGFTLVFVQVSIEIKAAVSLIGLAALLYIWTRPSKPLD